MKETGEYPMGMYGEYARPRQKMTDDERDRIINELVKSICFWDLEDANDILNYLKELRSVIPRGTHVSDYINLRSLPTVQFRPRTCELCMDKKQVILHMYGADKFDLRKRKP